VTARYSYIFLLSGQSLMSLAVCADWYISVVAVPVRRAMRLLAAAIVANFSRADKQSLVGPCAR